MRLRPERRCGSHRPNRTPLDVHRAAPDAQHRHQGGTRRRGDHQPGVARPRPDPGRHQGAERLRHRGRPRRRGRDHRHPARRLSGPRHPRRGVGKRARGATQRLRLDHRPARRHDQLHPRLPGLRGVDRRWPTAGRCSRPSSTTPSRNDLFYASKGRGAFLNDKRLRVSKRTAPGRLADRHRLSVPQGRQLQAAYLQMFEDGDDEQCAGLRRPGAAALDLCYVAAGWYDGFFETGLKPMGHRRRLADRSPRPAAWSATSRATADYLYQREVVAGNPKVYAQLVSILAALLTSRRGARAARGGRLCVRLAVRHARSSARTRRCDSRDRRHAAAQGSGTHPQGRPRLIVPARARDERTGARGPHADDGSSTCASRPIIRRHAGVLPDGRLLRVVLRRRASAPTSLLDITLTSTRRESAGEPIADGRRAGASRSKRLSRKARSSSARRWPSASRSATSATSQGPGRTQGGARGHAGHA